MSNKEIIPQHISSLTGVPIAMIACGSNHTFALSKWVLACLHLSVDHSLNITLPHPGNNLIFQNVCQLYLVIEPTRDAAFPRCFNRVGDDPSLGATWERWQCAAFPDLGKMACHIMDARGTGMFSWSCGSLSASAEGGHRAGLVGLYPA